MAWELDFAVVAVLESCNSDSPVLVSWIADFDSSNSVLEAAGMAAATHIAPEAGRN